MAAAQAAAAKTESVGDVLGEWAAFLEERIIPRLPDACEWKWVALQTRRELAQSRRPA